MSEKINNKEILFSPGSSYWGDVWLQFKKHKGALLGAIIFSGIVAEIPRALASTFELGRTGALSSLVIIGVIILLLVAIYFIVISNKFTYRGIQNIFIIIDSQNIITLNKTTHKKRFGFF